MIHFYKTKEPWGEFSNFARYPISFDGLEWPTSEHAYQAQKFLDPDLRERVRACATPKDAAKMGRDPTNPLREDWEAVMLDVMRRVVRAKFTQSPYLREQLLLTGDEEIAEHTANDSFWADGGTGFGQNWLGKILMELRAELRAEQG